MCLMSIQFHLSCNCSLWFMCSILANLLQSYKSPSLASSPSAPLMIRNVRFFSNSRVVKQVVELNGMADFKKAVLQSKSPALVDFYADWCQPCKAIAPLIDKFSNDETYTSKDIKFYKVNVDSNEDIVMEYGISAMPTFGFFANGDMSHKVIGASPQKVKESLDQLSQ